MRLNSLRNQSSMSERRAQAVRVSARARLSSREEKNRSQKEERDKCLKATH